MAKKFYVVWQGRQTGIFTDWPTCKQQVENFAGARYKSFATREEAEQAFGSTYTKSNNTNTQATAPITRKRPSAQTLKTYTADEITALPITTKIFTDGGCEPNPGKAGSGLAVYRQNEIAELWYGLYNPQGTNNTAELNALNQALIMATDEIARDSSVAIFCDSKYSIQCISQWAAGWEKKGWKKNGGEIKNLELIKEMFSRYQTLKDNVKLLHVNGHVGVEGNELADRMSMHAIATQTANLARYTDSLDIPAILAMRAG